MILKMPKIELHTHIGGCMRVETFKELAAEKEIDVGNLNFEFIKIPEDAF